MTKPRNAVLQLFSPLILTTQSMGGISDSTQKITDFMKPMAILWEISSEGDAAWTASTRQHGDLDAVSF